MRTQHSRSTVEDDRLRLLLILGMLLPLMILFFLPGVGLLLAAVWFWVMLIVIVMMMWMVLGVPREMAGAVGAPRQETIAPEYVAPEDVSPTWPSPPRWLSPAELPPEVPQIMDVHMALEQGEVVVVRGPLRTSPEEAFEALKRGASGELVPFLAEDEQFGARVILMPKRVEEAVIEETAREQQAGRVWVNWLLFGLTLITTTWAGAAQQGVNLLREPGRFWVGLPYAVGLLAILGVHELGHYFMAKYHGIKVTPPYFIPVPFALGTFGAFIQMKSPTENRKQMFDVAVAGPLAGLIVAIPVLLIGLEYSQLLSGPGAHEMAGLGATEVNSSILLSLIARAAIPDALQYGHVLRLHPMAFAGWLGLFVTALNLLPVGQLDGGHIARAMFGTRRGMIISRIAMWTLFLLALFVWQGLFMFALIVFFLSRGVTPPLNDLTPIGSKRKMMGWVSFAILVMILAPLPRALWDNLGIHCPYL